jgi:uncharacterized protein YlxW (UPF0749 family)
MNKEQHDPEPERYYDWMLWKMRQERKQESVVMTTEQMHQRELADMQAQVHALQLRVKELTDALLQLQEQRDR